MSSYVSVNELSIKGTDMGISVSAHPGESDAVLGESVIGVEALPSPIQVKVYRGEADDTVRA